LGGLGVLFLVLGFLLMVFSIALRFRYNLLSALLGFALFIVGSQTLIAGLLSELIVARSRTPQRTIHSVREEF